MARKSCTKNQFSLSSWVLRFYWKSVKDVRHSLLLWHDCIVRDVGQVFIGRDTDQLHMLSSRQKDCHRHFYFHLCRIVDDNVNENLEMFCVFCFNFSSFSSCSVTQVLCPRSSSKPNRSEYLQIRRGKAEWTIGHVWKHLVHKKASLPLLLGSRSYSPLAMP